MGRPNGKIIPVWLPILFRRKPNKAIGELSAERYSKLSETYENEQQTLQSRITELRSEPNRQQEIFDDINKFMKFAEKYSNVKELTPEIVNAFIDRVIIHEKEKVDGHYHHTIEIIYNFVGAINIPH